MEEQTASENRLKKQGQNLPSNGLFLGEFSSLLLQLKLEGEKLIMRGPNRNHYLSSK